jgi:hypothetical protein
MNIKDKYYGAKGHVQIYKIYKTGDVELFYEDKNIVCSGMGATLAAAFGASASSDLSAFQITLFQIGTGGSTGLQVSSTGQLGTALTLSEYGAGALEKVVQSLSTSGSTVTNQAFGIIPAGFIDKVSERKCRWIILMDEDAGNSKTVNEIGIFSKNPNQTNPAVAFLCAYKYFGDLAKTDTFSIQVVWTIEF